VCATVVEFNDASIEQLNYLIAGCCARASSGHAAEPLASVKNSHGLNRLNCIQISPARVELQDTELAMVSQWVSETFNRDNHTTSGLLLLIP
jgi:hypothetical protein